MLAWHCMRNPRHCHHRRRHSRRQHRRPCPRSMGCVSCYRTAEQALTSPPAPHSPPLLPPVFSIDTPIMTTVDGRNSAPVGPCHADQHPTFSPCFHIVRPLLTPGLNIAWGGQDMRGQPILRPGVKRGVRGCASLGSYRSGLSRIGVVTGLGSYGSG